MDSITVTRPVVVRVRVTDGYKKAAAAGVRDALAGTDARLAQLEAQYNKIAASEIGAEKENPRGPSGVLQQIEADRRSLLESRNQLSARLKEIGRMAGGQEIVHGRVESLVEISLGDDWGKLMSVEVVIEDGKVVEIRQGGLPQGSDYGR